MPDADDPGRWSAIYDQYCRLVPYDERLAYPEFVRQLQEREWPQDGAWDDGILQRVRHTPAI